MLCWCGWGRGPPAVTSVGPPPNPAPDPCQPLAKLDAAELEGLYSLLLAGAEASDDESVARWCTHMSRLIVAEVHRRELIQVAIDAKVGAIAAEERRLACEA